MKLQALLAFVLSGLFLFQQTQAQTTGGKNKHLSIITSLVVNSVSQDLEEDSVLRKHLKIELIAEDVFLANQKTAANWLLNDTAKLKKRKGVLRLPTTTGSKTF